jgi:hypothetical protein
VGRLADGPVAQQILEGTYKYPPNLDPATRLLFEEATATYAALSPAAVGTYVTVEDLYRTLAKYATCQPRLGPKHYANNPSY